MKDILNYHPTTIYKLFCSRIVGAIIIPKTIVDKYSCLSYLDVFYQKLSKPQLLLASTCGLFYGLHFFLQIHSDYWLGIINNHHVLMLSVN